MISAKTSKLLRAIAILIVIASHYAGWMYVDPIHVTAHDWIMKWGPEGVDIFLLMSGYGLVKSVLKGKKGKHNSSGVTAGFVLKRVIGAYLPSVLCLALIDIYDGTWTAAGVDGTVTETVLEVLRVSGFWYMNVLFVMYIAFMLIYRFGGRLRILLITSAVIAQTVYLFNKGYADFWELSNMAFLIGIYAAEAEHKWPDAVKKLPVKLIIMISGVSGMIYTFMGMQRHGGSRISETFGWELAFNIFFTITILGIAYFIPTWKGLIMTTLGECSLFVYMLHTTMFWALIFKFEEYGYAAAASVTGFITLAFSMLIGVLYNSLVGLITAKLR